VLKSSRNVLGVLLAAALLGAAFSARMAAQSPTTLRCFYDDAGRLTKVVDPSGNEADYTYDAAGNLLQITRPGATAPGSLAIFSFAPLHGNVGNSVTLQGQNFSAVPASNLVAFNGTPATVVSATSTTLVVTVPLGASTGPISLTVGASTVQTPVFTVLPAILISPLNPAVPLGKTLQFTATETLGNGSSMDVTTSVTWISSNPGVATIGAAGLAKSLSVGPTLIQAALGSLAASTTLTVDPAALVSLAVTPSNPSFAVGLNVQLFAVGTFTDDSVKDLTTAVMWSSTDTGVATVGAGTGVVTTIMPGTSTIAAAQGPVNGSTLLTVTAGGAGLGVPRFAFLTDLFGIGTGPQVYSLAVDAASGQLRPASILATPPANFGVAPATAIDPLGQFAYILSTNGLYGYTIDAHLGTLTAIPGSPFATSTTTNTEGVAIDPTGQLVLVTSSRAAAAGTNFVTAYTLGTGGVLTPAPGGPSPAGALPGPIAVDPSSTFVYVGNEDGNSISAYILNHSTGALTPVSGSPFAGCAPYSLAIDPFSKFLYGANLGSVCAYTINASGALTPVTGSPFFTGGTSPVWVAAEPSGKYLYAVNQNSNNVTGFSIDAGTGALTQIAQSPFSTGTMPVSMTIDPSGNFAYVVNQGSGNVTEFAINSATGALAPVRTYRSGSPARIAISKGAPLTFVPKAAYVTNQGGNTVSASTINASTGALTAVSNSPFATGMGPVSVAADPAAKFLYVANSTDGTVSGYSIDPATGALLQVTGSPFTAGSAPASVAVDPSDSFVYVVNDGSNNVSGYGISAATGTLAPIVTSPFAAQLAPSGIGMDPRGRFVYVPNQTSDSLSVFSIGHLGILSPTVSPLHVSATPVAALVDPTGNFVYVAISGANQVAAFSFSSVFTGALTQITGSPFAAGTNPAALATDPLGKFLYVADAGSNDVFAFSMNPFSGALTPVSNSPFPAGTKPSSVSVDFSGKFLYVVNSGSNNVSVFSIDPASGSLTAIPGSPFPAGTNPSAIYTTGSSQ
jgi:6-phosphogluconolactonase